MTIVSVLISFPMPTLLSLPLSRSGRGVWGEANENRLEETHPQGGFRDFR